MSNLTEYQNGIVTAFEDWTKQGKEFVFSVIYDDTEPSCEYDKGYIDFVNMFFSEEKANEKA